MLSSRRIFGYDIHIKIFAAHRRRNSLFVPVQIGVILLNYFLFREIVQAVPSMRIIGKIPIIILMAKYNNTC